MKNKLVRLVIVVCLSGMALSLTAWRIASTAQDIQTPQAHHTTRTTAGPVASGPLPNPQQSPDESDLPIVDFTPAEPAGVGKTTLRRLRNKRHDIGDETVDVKQFVLREDSAPVLLQLQSSHAPAEPAFPITQSDAIVIGEITDARAFLSNDRTNVYSEFTLRLTEVLRNSSTASLSSGMLITTERPGGRVRFPSGKILLRGGLYGRNMPHTDRHYVLFLNHNVEEDDFSIVTGYELREGCVFALDGKSVNERESPQFANYEHYRGAEESIFLSELRQVIGRSQRGQR